LRSFARQICRPGASLSAPVLERLLAYDWPGNVRELKNVVESSLIRGVPTDGAFGVMDLPLALQASTPAPTSRHDMERQRLLETLEATRWNKTEAARRLKWSRMTLYRKLTRHRLHVTSNRTSVTTSLSQ
jgi:transcriptional regulator of acetoin/glycerol metabolism